MGQNCVRPGLTSRDSRRSGGPLSSEGPFASGDGGDSAAAAAQQLQQQQQQRQQRLLRETLAGGSRKWRVGSPSLVYCIINSKAARHAAIIFDCQGPWGGPPGGPQPGGGPPQQGVAMQSRGGPRLHYAVCPWRDAADVQRALEDFHKCPNMTIRKQQHRKN